MPAKPNHRQLQAWYEKALACHGSGDTEQAQSLYGQILKAEPRHVEALHMAGILLAQQNNFSSAVALISEAVRLQPAHANAHNNLGNVLQEMGELDSAVQHYDRAISLKPAFANAMNNRGVVRNEQGHHEAAALDFRAALAIQPHYPAACSNLGLALEALGQLEEALDFHDRAVALQPGHFESQYNRGKLLLKLQSFEAARLCIAQALALAPNFAQAHLHLGLALEGLEQTQAALACFDQALSLEPDLAEALLCRGRMLHTLKQPDLAEASYQQAVHYQPELAEAHCFLGQLRGEQQDYLAGLNHLNQAIKLKPDLEEAYSHRGLMLQHLKQHEAALSSYDAALALNPKRSEVHNNRGAVLHALQRLNEAHASFKQALVLKPDYAHAYINQGNLLLEIKLDQQALESYTQALQLNSDYAFLEGIRLHVQMKVCNWDGLASQISQLLTRIEAHEKASPPFGMLAITANAELQRNASVTWLQSLDALPKNWPALLPHLPHRRIRIAYFSADFYDHPTAYLMAELFELHDRERFEVIAISFGPDKNDGMRQRLDRAFEQFIHVRDVSDEDIVMRARNLNLDIAIDLKGYTQGSRPRIFAMRVAPIQVNYLAYPGTMGADFMDYLVADHTLIPPQSQVHYTEKIAYLPHSYQVNDAQRQISDRVFTREVVGLPPTGFVFCCFNNNYKITPDTFDGWMRILQAVPDSVLWLLADNPTAAQNLSDEAELRGVSAKRLVFAPRLGLAEHLARHRLADLFIDTLPCNAHTTASDALWAGLPVLTCMGEAFASRVAASLLKAVGLPELVTESQPAYETLAIELASHPEKLAVIKLKLERNRLTTPLFDTASYARHLEALYEKMHARAREGLPVEHLNAA